MSVRQFLSGCFVSLLLFGLITPTFADNATPDSSTLSYKDAQDLVLLTTELRSGDNSQIDQAIAQIKEWVGEGHVQMQLWHEWVPSMITDQRYQDAADLALAGALARPDIKYISQLMFLRTRALLALGDSDQAIQAAKGYYNVCYMKNTPNAIQLVAQCLTQVHPNDSDIAQRFLNQQSSASDVTPDAGTTTQPATPMLTTIQIDPTLYADSLNKWKNRTVLTGDFNDFASYANVLLVADQPNQALKIFETLYKQASMQDDLNTAIEGIARSMRAQDGNVGRANAWLLSLQKQSGAPAAAGQ